jgi:IMP dehydrogenase
MTEGNSKKIKNSYGKYYKEYWMEGTKKAFNNRRYDNTKSTFFEEGISGFVYHSGSIYNILPEYANRLRATLSTTGVNNIDDFHKNAVLEKISSETKADSSVNNVILKDLEECRKW